MLSLGLSLASPAIMRGVRYDAASEAIFAAFTSPASGERKSHIDAYVKALKAAAVWGDLDVFYVLAAADSQAARINWKNPGVKTLSVVNSPAFATDRGYTGNGSSSYLNTGWFPATEGVKYLQNDASIWVWSRTELDATVLDIGSYGGPSAAIYCSTAFSGLAGLVNSATVVPSVIVPSSIGLFGMQRVGASEIRSFHNGVQVGANAANASTGRPGLAQWICGANPPSFSVRQESIAAWGASLAGKELAFYNATLAYLQAVGAA